MGDGGLRMVRREMVLIFATKDRALKGGWVYITMRGLLNDGQYSIEIIAWRE